jgi:hypothetical protein
MNKYSEIKSQIIPGRERIRRKKNIWGNKYGLNLEDKKQSDRQKSKEQGISGSVCGSLS